MHMQSMTWNNYYFYAGSIWFSSEMKALSDDCERFVSFLPGHIYSSKNGMLIWVCISFILTYLFHFLDPVENSLKSHNAGVIIYLLINQKSEIYMLLLRKIASRWFPPIYPSLGVESTMYPCC